LAIRRPFPSTVVVLLSHAVQRRRVLDLIVGQSDDT
jgi:hypothetical protein